MENLGLNINNVVLSKILHSAEEMEYEPTADFSLTYGELQAVVCVLCDVYNAFTCVDESALTPNANNFLDDLHSAYIKINEAN